MFFDGHSDILYAMNQHYQRGERDIFRRRYLSWFQRGNVEGGIFVLWSNPDTGVPTQTQVTEQLAVLQKELKQAEDSLMILNTQQDFENAMYLKKAYFLLGAEGLDGYMQHESAVDWLYERGVRHIGLTWNQANGFAGGVFSDTGLTETGRKAIRRIEEKRMLLDVSHLNDKSLRDVLLTADGPVIASHSNSRRLCSVPRNLTDEQIKAIAATGGVIGINSHPSFVNADRKKQNLEHLADHLVHMADLVGTDHLGFGFDLNYWDDGANAEEMEELKGYDRIMEFLQLLKRKGFSGGELQQISRGNFLRMVRYTLV